MTPPLRSRADRLAITEGLLDGTIDAICSDHTPVDDDEKLLPFGEATPGATGLELLLSLTLKWGQSLENDPSNLSKAIAKITSDPAGILGKNCGKLSVGDKADICVSILLKAGLSRRQNWQARENTHRFWDVKYRDAFV